MSIDDMVQRDPRITMLAKRVGWSRRETLGCLIADVWPICYDQRDHIIAADLVDAAAGSDGFAAAMVEVELAEWVRGNRKVRIRGAKERIEYLDHQKRSGRVGGIKSAESRQNNSSKPQASGKQASSTTGSKPQALGNPSVPPSASASASASASVPDPFPVPDLGDTSAPPRQPKPEKRKARISPDWEPRPEERRSAHELGLDCDREAAQFRNHFLGKGEPRLDWNASFRTWLSKARQFADERGQRNRQPAQRDVFALIDAHEIGKDP